MTRELAAAGIAFIAAAGLFAGTLRSAAAPAIPSLELAAHQQDDEAAMIREPLMDEAALTAVVDGDPFQPDRQRPPRRYRLPGDVDPPPPPPPPPPPEVPHFRVAGTAVLPDGGFALMRIGDGPERVLSVGDFLGGYQLHQIVSDAVVMKNDEREVTVMVPGPSPQVAAAQPQRAPAPPRPGQAPQPMTQEQARRMAEILERARSEGASPQMLQAIQQLIQQRGIDSFLNMDIVIEGGTLRMTPRRPPGGGREERI
jgi:hypothetical protein